MTQAEVMNILKKTNEWLCAKEIADILGRDNPNTIRLNLYKLFNQKAVSRKSEGKKPKKHYIYQIK